MDKLKISHTASHTFNFSREFTFVKQRGQQRTRPTKPSQYFSYQTCPKQRVASFQKVERVGLWNDGN